MVRSFVWKLLHAFIAFFWLYRHNKKSNCHFFHIEAMIQQQAWLDLDLMVLSFFLLSRLSFGAPPCHIIVDIFSFSCQLIVCSSIIYRSIRCLSRWKVMSSAFGCSLVFVGVGSDSVVGRAVSGCAILGATMFFRSDLWALDVSPLWQIWFLCDCGSYCVTSSCAKLIVLPSLAIKKYHPVDPAVLGAVNISTILRAASDSAILQLLKCCQWICKPKQLPFVILSCYCKILDPPSCKQQQLFYVACVGSVFTSLASEAAKNLYLPANHSHYVNVSDLLVKMKKTILTASFTIV